MRGRHGIHVVGLAGGGGFTVKAAAIPGAKAAGLVLHGRTEERLLAALGYAWDLKARQINTHVLDYIDFVRAGGKVDEDTWPPKFKKEAA